MTRLAAEPLSWLNHARWEQLADTYMDARPLAASCGYERSEIGEPGLEALGAVHPLRPGGASPFGVFVLDRQVWDLLGFSPVAPVEFADERHRHAGRGLALSIPA